jgi:hypothetical protein
MDYKIEQRQRKSIEIMNFLLVILVLLMTIYLLGLEVNLSEWRIISFLFLGIEACRALNERGVLTVRSKFKYLIVLIVFFFLCCATCYDGTIYHKYMVRAFVVFGVVTVLNITDWLEGTFIILIDR